MKISLKRFLVLFFWSIITGNAMAAKTASVDERQAAKSQIEMHQGEKSQGDKQQNEKPQGEKMTIWIDVRTAEEFNQGHVNGSINIPFEIIGKEISTVTRDVDTDIRVYCRSGRRSGVAKDTLNGLGYQNVVNEGGYEDIVKRKAAGEDLP